MNKELPYSKTLVDANSDLYQYLVSDDGNPVAVRVKFSTERGSMVRVMLPHTSDVFTAIRSVNLGAYILDAYHELVQQTQLVTENMYGLVPEVKKKSNDIVKQMAIPKCFKIYEQDVKLPDTLGGFITIRKQVPGEEYNRMKSMLQNLMNLGYIKVNFFAPHTTQGVNRNDMDDNGPTAARYTYAKTSVQGNERSI